MIKDPYTSGIRCIVCEIGDMEYQGDDENFDEVWECLHCGEIEIR